MKLKTLILGILIFIQVSLSGQDKTQLMNNTLNGTTYLVDFSEKGFVVVNEGDKLDITFFDNELNQKWEVNLEKGKFNREDIEFHITESGETIYIITYAKDNSNFILSISADGSVAEHVKIKYRVIKAFCTGENLIVEVFKVSSGISYTGYEHKNDRLVYLKFAPDLSFEKFKMKVPVIKQKGEKKYAKKFMVGATSDHLYFGQAPEFSDATEYLKVLKLDYDGRAKSIRVPFRVSSDYEEKYPSDMKHAYGVRTNTTTLLRARFIKIDETKNRMIILRGLGNSISVSTHNLDGGLLSIEILEIGETPAKYKNWKVRIYSTDNEKLRVDLLFLMEENSFSLFSYSMGFNGENLKKEIVSCNWDKPMKICNGKTPFPHQFDIITLSEFGALPYFRKMNGVSENNYGSHFKDIRYLKRKDSEILFVLDEKQIQLLLFKKSNLKDQVDDF